MIKRNFTSVSLVASRIWGNPEVTKNDVLIYVPRMTSIILAHHWLTHNTTHAVALTWINSTKPGRPPFLQRHAQCVSRQDSPQRALVIAPWKRFRPSSGTNHSLNNKQFLAFIVGHEAFLLQYWRACQDNVCHASGINKYTIWGDYIFLLFKAEITVPRCWNKMIAITTIHQVVLVAVFLYLNEYDSSR